MPTIFTHGLIAGVAARISGTQEGHWRLWAAATVVAILPDADVIGLRLGVPYGHFFGHRGFFHSPFFALLLSFLILALFFREHRPLSRTWWKYLLVLFFAGASHGVLDAFTDGGLGIALLSPFDDTRMFFPWTPIPVAPLGFGAFFGEWGLRIMLWEAVFLWIPLVVLHVLVLGVSRKVRAHRLARASGPASGSTPPPPTV